MSALSQVRYSLSDPRSALPSEKVSSLKRLCLETLLNHPVGAAEEEHFLSLPLQRDIHPRAVEPLLKRAVKHNQLSRALQILGVKHTVSLDLRTSCFSTEQALAILDSFPKDNRLLSLSISIKGQADPELYQMIAKRLPELYELSVSHVSGINGGAEPLSASNIETVGSLKNLQYLSLDGVRLNAESLAGLSSLALQKLNLCCSVVDLEESDELGPVQNMQAHELTLDDITVRGAHRDLSTLLKMVPIERLESLRLRRARYSPELLKKLQDAEHLKYLEISNSPVGDVVFEILGKLPNLKSLTLSGTRTADRHLESLSELKLQELILSGTEVDGSFLKTINTEHLRVLGLKNCRLVESHLETADLPQLRELVLTRSQGIQGTCLKGLHSSPLMTLSLMGCDDLDWEKLNLANLRYLRELALTATEVPDSQLTQLRQLGLERLWLAQCPQLTDEGLRVLAQHHSKWICLTGNTQLSKGAIAELAASCQVEYLS